jgi:hypothetical protein
VLLEAAAQESHRPVLTNAGKHLARQSRLAHPRLADQEDAAAVALANAAQDRQNSL